MVLISILIIITLAIIMLIITILIIVSIIVIIIIIIAAEEKLDIEAKQKLEDDLVRAVEDFTLDVCEANS